MHKENTTIFTVNFVIKFFFHKNTTANTEPDSKLSIQANNRNYHWLTFTNTVENLRLSGTYSTSQQSVCKHFDRSVWVDTVAISQCGLTAHILGTYRYSAYQSDSEYVYKMNYMQAKFKCLVKYFPYIIIH